jgi:hypothetical protein
MCRRWTGAAFATLVWFPRKAIRWTAGEPALYRSSPIAVRSHCASCGTPLHLAYDSGADLAITAGSLDAPDSVTPTYHYGCEGRLRWADVGAALPQRRTQETWGA